MESPALFSDQSYSEAIGWLVSAVGRGFMLDQVARAEGSNDVVAAQLRDWTERLTPEGETTDALQEFRINRAALAVGTEFPTGNDEDDRHVAEVALRGAGVIR